MVFTQRKHFDVTYNHHFCLKFWLNMKEPGKRKKRKQVIICQTRWSKPRELIAHKYHCELLSCSRMLAADIDAESHNTHTHSSIFKQWTLNNKQNVTQLVSNTKNIHRQIRSIKTPFRTFCHWLGRHSSSLFFCIWWNVKLSLYLLILYPFHTTTTTSASPPYLLLN